MSVNSIAFISGIALLLEFAVSITRSVHAIEVSVVRDPFRSLSNVNLSGSQNASKNAAAAAEKTE